MPFFPTLFWSSITCFFLLNIAVAQKNIPLGAWRVHAPYQSLNTLALADDRIYAGASAGIFFFALSENTTSTLSTSDGLSEINITKIAYHSPTQTTILTYNSGAIDLIRQGTIKNLLLIKNSSITGSKRINHIFLRDNLAYLSTDFGIIVLDLIKQEIRETWQNLGSTGVRLRILAVVASSTRFFFISPEGIYSAPATANLADFNSWKSFSTTEGLPLNASGEHLLNTGEKIFAALAGEGLFEFQGNTWQKVNSVSETNINGLSVIDNQLAVCLPNRIVFLDNNNQITNTLQHPLIISPQQIITDNQNNYWIADAHAGLVGNFEGEFRSYTPNGPFSNKFFRVSGFDKQIYVTAGGFNENGQPFNRQEGLYVFTQQGKWINYNASTKANNRPLLFSDDLTSVAFNSTTQILSLGSLGKGILRINRDSSQVIINGQTPNTPFSGKNTVLIGSLFTDSQGNNWVGELDANNSVHVERPGGSWQSFGLGNPTRNPVQILEDFNGYKWIRLLPTGSSGGLWVIDERENRNKLLTVANSGLTTNQILSMALDRQGVMWLGTQTGVATIPDPFNVFNTTFEVSEPFFQGRPLFNNQPVQAIAVDGANRKWMGTRNGIFVFDQEANRLLFELNQENSPLLSNNILDIAVEGSTGEVFIITDQGLISYRDGVSEAAANFNNVKVFPNPVLPTFSGLVGIEGLAENADVRITDISGKLMYRTQARGGTASWNVRDYTGRRAAAGIYLVFSANAEGEDQVITKIAVLE